MLLAIDTSAGTSVAVVDRDRGVLAERGIPDTMRHAEVVGTLIDECLREAGIAVSELSGVVGGMGPGPFTGLRVGIAAARVFALGAGTAFVPLVSHDALEPTWEHIDVLRFDAATVSAGDLGMVAELSLATGKPFAADEPLYLRSPDVTLSAGPKRVS